MMFEVMRYFNRNQASSGVKLKLKNFVVFTLELESQINGDYELKLVQVILIEIKRK